MYQQHMDPLVGLIFQYDSFNKCQAYSDNNMVFSNLRITTLEELYGVPASPVTSSHMLLRHLDLTHSSQQLVSETIGGGVLKYISSKCTLWYASLLVHLPHIRSSSCFLEDLYDVPASPVTSSHMLMRHLDLTHSSQQLVSETIGAVFRHISWNMSTPNNNSSSRVKTYSCY